MIEERDNLEGLWGLGIGVVGMYPNNSHLQITG
jgi:hypothetical protein